MKTTDRKIHELMGLAMKVHLETKYCVFIRMSGHVEQIEIDIRESKSDYQTELIKGEVYFDEKNKNRFEKRYRKMRGVLLSILENGKIDYNHPDIIESERIVYDYNF